MGLADLISAIDGVDQQVRSSSIQLCASEAHALTELPFCRYGCGRSGLAVQYAASTDVARQCGNTLVFLDVQTQKQVSDARMLA